LKKNNLQEAENNLNRYCVKNHVTLLKYTQARELCLVRCDSCGKEYKFTQYQNALTKAKRHSGLCNECDLLRKRQKSFEGNLRTFFPEESFEIVSFLGTTKPLQIRCGKCGKIKQLENAKSLLHNKHICSNCFPARYIETEKTKKDFLRFIVDSPKWELIDKLEEKDCQSKIQCKCKLCGDVSYKTMYLYMNGVGCSRCYGNKKRTTEEFKNELDDNYELLSEYKGNHKNVLIRHTSCGFIFKMTPDAYVNQFQRCPQCKRKQSKGEKIVQDVLDKYNIEFTREHSAKICGRTLRFDFYLPKLDKYIEFNGVQHYEITRFTPSETALKDLQYRDNLKREYAGKNLLVISYKDIKKIEKIITSQLWFKDYLEKE
jgi:hypothetical protein